MNEEKKQSIKESVGGLLIFFALIFVGMFLYTYLYADPSRVREVLKYRNLDYSSVSIQNRDRSRIDYEDRPSVELVAYQIKGKLNNGQPFIGYIHYAKDYSIDHQGLIFIADGVSLSYGTFYTPKGSLRDTYSYYNNFFRAN